MWQIAEAIPELPRSNRATAFRGSHGSTDRVEDQRCRTKTSPGGTDRWPSARRPRDASHRRASRSAEEEQTDEKTIDAAARLRLEKIDRAGTSFNDAPMSIIFRGIQHRLAGQGCAGGKDLGGACSLGNALASAINQPPTN
jgi:hypothetical protein